MSVDPAFRNISKHQTCFIIWRIEVSGSFKLSLDDPLVLTSSGGYQNMNGWQAGGTHPTGMLSCISLKIQWICSELTCDWFERSPLLYEHIS